MAHGRERHDIATAAQPARIEPGGRAIPTLAFDAAAADAYDNIVAHAGYSGRRLLDRMIAAQALVHRATLVMLNADDFGDVPGLRLRAWRARRHTSWDDRSCAMEAAPFP